MPALYGGISTQTGAFDALAGPQARALRGAHGPIETHQRYAGAYLGNLGSLQPYGVQDSPLVGTPAYAGIVPSNPLTPSLERINPWTDPAAQLR